MSINGYIFKYCKHKYACSYSCILFDNVLIRNQKFWKPGIKFIGQNPIHTLHEVGGIRQFLSIMRVNYIRVFAPMYSDLALNQIDSPARIVKRRRRRKSYRMPFIFLECRVKNCLGWIVKRIRFIIICDQNIISAAISRM